MPSPTRSLYAALDCARTLIEQGETDATAHGGWLGVILSATPKQVTELYQAAGMPVPQHEATADQPAQWIPHRNAVTQRVVAFLQKNAGATRAELAKALQASPGNVGSAILRLRKRGVNIVCESSHGVAMYKLVKG
jgi:7-cyano-7-deazaguanine synthase in queuosine biosynthesis